MEMLDCSFFFKYLSISYETKGFIAKGAKYIIFLKIVESDNK